MNNVLAYFPIDDRCKFIFLTFLNFRLGRGIQIGLCRCNSSLQNSNHQLFHLCIYIYPQHNVASRPERSQVQSRFLVYCFLCICTVGKMLLTFGRLINHFWTFIAVLDGLVWLCTIICILSFLYFYDFLPFSGCRLPNQMQWMAILFCCCPCTSTGPFLP